MNTVSFRPLLSICAALLVGQLSRAADAVTYSPATTSLTGVEPYAYGPQSIVITPPKLAAGTYKITLTVTNANPTSGGSALIPSGVSSATATSFATLGGTGVTLVSPGVYSVSYSSTAANITVSLSESIPVGAYAGSYSYFVTATGWPAKDSAGNAITASYAQFSETIAAPAPAVAIASPISGQAFTIPAGQSTVQVPYSIQGSTVVGSTISAATGSLTGVSGFSPVFYGLGTAAVTTNIGTAGSQVTVGLSAGTYTLSATDTNNLGGTASSTAVTFTVVNPAVPTISITSPANGQVFSANGSGSVAVPFAISGKTSSGTISAATASLIQGGTSAAVVVFPTGFSGIGTASVGDSGTVNLAPGTYTLSASDTASSGGATYGPTAATPVTFTVLGAPTISIASPASGQVFEVGSTGTAAVSYLISGSTASGSSFASASAGSATLTSSTGASTSGFAPSFALGTGTLSSSGSVSLAPGTYTLSASDTNNLGGASGTASVTFTVAGPPTIAITSPSGGQVFEVGSAGTAAVSYAISGATPSGTAFTSASAGSATLSSVTGFAPTFTVGTSGSTLSASGTVNLAAGTYTLGAAETNSLKGGASASVTFTVVGLPTISISSPSAGAVFSTTAAGTAIVSYSISGSTPAGTSLKSAAATLTLNGKAVTTFIPVFSGLPAAAGSTVTSTTASASLALAPGTYTLAATETNNLGGTASSGTVTFSVVSAPTVSITAPSNGASFAIVNGSTTAPVAWAISATTPAGSTFASGSAATATLSSSTGASASGFAPVFTLGTGSASISASGTANLGPGTYTLSAKAANSLGQSASASPVTFTVTAPATTVTNSISTNFNSTVIAKGNYLWFSSVIKLQGVGSSGATILLSNSTISFTVGGTPVTLQVPPAVINFESGITAATSTYNVTNNTWTTTVPANYTGNVFVSGVPYQAAATIPGNLSGVKWTGTYSADTAGVTAEWQWGAAVYTSFSTTVGALGVKPVDNNTASPYKDSYTAGTPENFLSYLVVGGTGTAGSFYTGAYGADVQFIVPDYLL